MSEETIGPADDAPAYAPDPFDPAKRGSSYRDLFQAATELATEDATAVAAMLRDRDATIATLTAALVEARGALEESRSFVELAYEDTDGEEAADAKIVMGQIDAAVTTINTALGRVEG